MKNTIEFHIKEHMEDYDKLFDVPANTSIHLSTELPLPEKLLQLEHLTNLHILGGRDETFMGIVGQITSLKVLVIERPIPFGRIPDDFYNLVNLTHLAIINTWFGDTALSEKISNFAHLEYLEIRGLYKSMLPEVIGSLTNLKKLIVRDTNQYLEGSSNIGIPDTIWNLVNLTELRIGPCLPFDRHLNQKVIDPAGIPNLSKLEIFEFLYHFTSIPDKFWQNENLREVTVYASEQETLPSLANIHLENLTLRMPKLKTIPPLPKTLKRLWLRSNRVASFPDLDDTQIEELHLESDTVTTLPKLPSTLKRLTIELKSLEKLPELPNILRLRLHSCYNLLDITDVPDTLKKMEISFCNKLPSLPMLPPIEAFSIRYCDGITKLPNKLIVDTIIIEFCKNLKRLPEDTIVNDIIQITGQEIDYMPEFPDSVTVRIWDDY